MTQRAIAYAVYCTEPDGTADVNLFADAEFSQYWARWCVDDGCEVNVKPLYADSEIGEALAVRTCLLGAQ